MGDFLERKNILLIDDDTIFQTVVISMLSDKYNVVTSKSGKDALILLVKDKPDLILLDILMPEMDGWETYHKIKGMSLLHQVPIAFLTSVSKSEGFEHAEKLGASDYFTKPLDKTDFLDRIGKILSG